MSAVENVAVFAVNAWSHMSLSAAIRFLSVVVNFLCVVQSQVVNEDRDCLSSFLWSVETLKVGHLVDEDANGSREVALVFGLWFLDLLLDDASRLVVDEIEHGRLPKLLAEPECVL